MYLPSLRSGSLRGGLRLLFIALTFWLGLIRGGSESLAQTGDEPTTRTLGTALAEQVPPTPEEAYVSPDQAVRDAFGPPPHAKALSPRNVWIDRDKQRVYVDGYVAMQEGPLEEFACPMGTKEHESIVGSLARASEVHAALLAVGARSGTPVQVIPRFLPATGQRIRIWVCYRDKDQVFHAVDAKTWVRKAGTDEQMDIDWVFAGSGFWKDPDDGSEFYQADSGDMICLSNFSTAMLDVPIVSSADEDDLLFLAFTERIPPRGTPLRLVLVPIPIPSDTVNESDSVETVKKPIDPDQPPGEDVLPRKSQSPAVAEPSTEH